MTCIIEPNLKARNCYECKDYSLGPYAPLERGFCRRIPDILISVFTLGVCIVGAPGKRISKKSELERDIKKSKEHREF